jgi:uncharacterized protein (TIGR03435 family)
MSPTHGSEIRRAAMALAILLPAAAQLCAAYPKVGSPAPEISLDRLLPDQPVSNVSRQALAGKAVVLEFWGAWCSGCVTEIAHLNQLTEAFAALPIVFLSATADEPEGVIGFLKNRPIRGLVGLAYGTRLFQDYGVVGLPVTVLIDSAGKVAAVTRPTEVTAAVLEDLLAGRAVTVKPLEEPDVALDIGVQVSGGEVPPGRKRMFQANLRMLFMHLYHFNAQRIEGPALADTRLYDFFYSVPAARWEEVRPLAQQLVSVALRLQARREERTVDVLVLRAPGGPPAALKEVPAQAGVTFSSRSSYRLPGGQVSSLAYGLESRLKRPVFDETGLNGWYDIRIKWDAAQPESIVEAVRTQLGLTVETARRKVEYLVVGPAQ